MSDALASFLLPTQRWFSQRFGEPTPPQTLGWPAIQRGENTLILSPTGSGKTLAAFLWGIDRIYHDLEADSDLSGVQLLYVSPLTALNNDIARNLREPLRGIRATSTELGAELPVLHTAVRTGDTPQSARRRMVTQPPHILITTPESLYLILTSPRAREILRSVKTVILDEIHTLCGNKRGVHLALSLERLEALAARPFQRIGLSATQRPLDEVARFLGGQEWDTTPDGIEQLVSREVTIVDAGAKKEMDLRIITPVGDLRRLPGRSIWPSLIPDVLNVVRRHRTTLVFVNGRRAAEQAADRLNEQYALEEAEEIPPGSPAGLVVDGVAKGQGFFGTGRVDGPFRAHHGSVSRQVRLDLESKLKAGELPALIATGTLELGIDIGQVDVVVQLQSPHGIARGLQRVGRSGHLVGQTSVGRIYATYREDLLDAGAVVHGMYSGDIEPTHTPQNCLDVLAQQIVAMVSVQDWPVEALYRLVRQVYGYARLTHDVFEAVLKMLSGGYPSDVFRELRPRLSWDRVNGVLAALPGARLLAIRNGGTIVDRGEFRVYLPDGKTMLGVLDEEFVYETHKGDVFTLGSNTWRVLDMDDDKLVVGDAAGSLPRMPFWKGEMPKRDYHMGLRLGRFRRELAARVADLPRLPESVDGQWPQESEVVVRWLGEHYGMDEASAHNAIHYVRQQLDVLGAISSDSTVIVERFSDALGDGHMVVHSPFGARVNTAWALALSHALQERLGVRPETQANDNGILFHFLESDRDPPVDLVRDLGGDEVRERLLLELPSSALFGAEFRMNASRALLLPGVRGSQKRTPFWLQRLRARTLLGAAKSFDDFPIIAETYRSCLNDVLDLPHLLDVLDGIRSGQVQVIEAETIIPSPVAEGLLFGHKEQNMYAYDEPAAERQIQALTFNRELLSQLVDEGLLPDLLRPEALEGVIAELQHLAEGYQARSAEELAVLLHDLGDLTTEEVQARCLGEGRTWLLRLVAQGRVFQVEVPAGSGRAQRWVSAEDYRRYRDAFGLPDEPPSPLPPELLEERRSPEAALETLLRQTARTHGPLTRDEFTALYAFPGEWLDETLEELTVTGVLVGGHLSPGSEARQWCDRRVLERIHRRTLSLLRKEIRPVELPPYADFLVRWQGVHPAHRDVGRDGLLATMQQLRGLSAPAVVWERDLLPLRMQGYRPADLDALCAEEGLVWVASGAEARHARQRFLFRGEGGTFLPAVETPDEEGEPGSALSEMAGSCLAFIKQEGACYAEDIQRGLGLSATDLDGALVELLLGGLVTNDDLGAMRLVIRGAGLPRAETHGVASSLDAALGEWRARRGPSASGGVLHRPSRGRLRQARRLASRRAGEQAGAHTTRWRGRWALVDRPGLRGEELTHAERAERLAWQFLDRYGILCRECLENEEGDWTWGQLYRPLQTLELRGAIRRGYFVRGLSGVQFASPGAVEQLRSWSKPDAEGRDELVLLNAWDPALLYGPALSDQGRDLGAGLAEGRNPYRFSRIPANYVVLQRGVPVLLYEHGGRRWVSLPGVREGTLREAVSLLVRHLTQAGGLCAQPPRVLVEAWNGEPPVGGEAESLLEPLGFRREALALVWDGL